MITEHVMLKRADPDAGCVYSAEVGGDDVYVAGDAAAVAGDSDATAVAAPGHFDCRSGRCRIACIHRIA